MEFKLGAIPSSEDPRDYPLTNLIAMQSSFPEEFILDYPGDVKNQGQIGSCMAHSLAYSREITEAKQSGEFKQFSVGFIYANRVGTLGELLGQEGMSPRDALQNLVLYGDVPFEDFPQNDTYPVVNALLEQDREFYYYKASPHRISAYARLYSVDEIKTALLQLGPVSICCPIYSSFYTVSQSNPIVPIPNTNNESLQGYHEMTIIGWRKDNTWIVLNSWGKDWGDNGRCYMPFSFPVAEYWSMTDTLTANMNSFIEMVRPGAIKAYYKHGIKASLTIVQGILESAWGAKAPGNNFFGIKWYPGCGYDYQIVPTWEYINNKWIKVEDKFKKYASIDESIEDHTKLFLTTRLQNGSLRYQRVIDAKTYQEACVAVRECGYATDPKYSQKLINVIDQ